MIRSIKQPSKARTRALMAFFTRQTPTVTREWSRKCMYRHISPYKLLLIFSLQLGLAVIADSQVIKNAVPEMAHPLPLSSVRLTGGPLKTAQDLDAKYLL